MTAHATFKYRHQHFGFAVTLSLQSSWHHIYMLHSLLSYIIYLLHTIPPQTSCIKCMSKSGKLV